MIEMYQRVALIKDIPDKGLLKGDVATIVEQLPATPESGNEPGYALEIMNAVGETTDVIFIPVSYVRKLTSHEIFHIRPLAQA